MPLSQDFSNSRLEYLKNAVTNKDIVTAQFYPRYQRFYNASFPFTEASITNTQNPQQQLIKGNLKPTTIEDAKLNLETKLNPITGDSSVSTDIISKLSKEQILYYDEHFNTIQKEL